MTTISPGLIASTFSITAYGQAAGGQWPKFILRLNGKEIGTATVDSASPKKYVFTADVPPDQAHLLQLEYTNDGFINGQDRNLFVQSFQVNDTLIPTNSSIVTYDRGALDGKDVIAGQEAMYWRGALNVALPSTVITAPKLEVAGATGSATTTPSMVTEIKVTAWGVSAGGIPPHFKLIVDDKVVGEAKVSATSPTTYTFKATVNPDEAHKIQVHYDNDSTVNGVDRNLYVRSIAIDGKEIKATDPLASYDIGVVDGKNVIAGQEGLWWGGALTFGVPEDYFGGPVVRPPPPPPPAPTKMVDIVVNASGTPAGGVPPHFKVIVDGKVIGDAKAGSSATTAYTFKATIDPKVAHDIQIHYDNDGVVNGQDRNLFVKSVVINGTEVKSTAPGVTYDRGAVDGKDIIAGQEGLFWGGALKVTAPSSYFTKTVVPPPTGPAFYVSPNGKDTWSGKLSQPNADGTDGPFASLERARDAMRADPNVDTTYVREGTYQLTKTLELTSLDNGAKFKNYPGEAPVLSGGEKVTGFVSEGNGIYSAKLGSASGLDVTVGGVRQHLAEKGAWDASDVTSGWFFGKAAASGPSTTAIRYQDGELSASDYAPGTKIQVFDVERLTDAIVEVSRIDAATRTIYFKSAIPFALQDGATFRLLDNASYVNQGGEFAWRAADGKLVIKPVNPSSFVQDGVVVARLDTLIKMTGVKGAMIEGLGFENTKSGTGAALEISGGSANKIGNNHFENVGTGIALKGSSNNLIGGNVLEHLGVNGIEVTANSNYNQVYANTIEFIGEVRKHVAGIWMNGADENVISHNDIAHSARYGISLKNWNSTTTNIGNVIEYNHVTDTVRETADAGAIELLGRSNLNTDTLIRGNWVEGVGGLATSSAGVWLTNQKGFGIYLDDLTGGVTVRGNFLKDTGWAGVHIHGGDNNLVENNFSILGRNVDEFIRIGWNPKFGDAGTPVNNTVIKNLIAGTLPLDDYHELLSANNPNINNNFVYNVPTYGANDASGKPLFVDPYYGNYALQDGSPVLAKGIADLAWNMMGEDGYHASTTIPLFWDL